MANIDMSRIAGNIGALNSLNSLNQINSNLAIHQTRLATGKRLNSAADDPAGMLIATTFDVRRAGMQTALSAIGDAKNLMSVMEGGLNKVREIMVKMRNKALEAQGDTLGADEKQAIADQLKAYRDEINDIVLETQWNGTKLIGESGSTSGSVDFLTSPDKADGSSYTDTFGFTAVAGKMEANQSFFSATNGTAGADDLGLNDTALTSVTGSGGSAAIAAIDTGLGAVKAAISQVGAFTARLTFKEEALSVAHANVESAYNRIMNADMAKEQVEASKYGILQQTATTMLSQANVAPQFLLSLFR